ncbi:sensor histidine kinase [Bdellovibrio sp. KM01]|uniref:sensor histidine kinase n=1 Tax=Bdellovibrio sp. KM01 TaxID=2748865 RepID=UPI0015EA4D75|nr:HAMP domain-containing sensor histidine kinase [Bdellovibrio sp. KM01]QLY26110.1 HAMP domain-containing histidine kinase [Bdellovibrio sp. KM01]
MKVKLLAVLIAVAALFIGAVLWRTDSFVYGDRMNWVEAQTRTQISSISRSLGGELKSLQRLTATFNADNFQKNRINWSTIAPYYAVASVAVNGSDIEPQVLLTKDNSKAANWNNAFVKAALGKIDNRTNDLKFFVKPFQDTNRGRYVAVVLIEGNRGYALFSSGEIFQSQIDSERGSLSSFSIVTTNGLTVGHTIPEYLGTVMRDDPMFREIAKSGATHGGGVVDVNAKQKLYGMFEQVPQSNLWVLSSAPMTEALKGRTGLWWQFALMGLGLVLVGIAAVLWVVAPAENKIEKLETDLIAAQKKAAAAPPVEKTVIADPETAQNEKVQTSMRVASALAHEMRGPLSSILGYSQMILAKHPEGEIVDNTDSILRETRAAREIINKLLGYAGEEIKEKNSMKVEGPLARALKNLEGELQNNGVKLVRNIQETAAVDLHADALTKAFENILTNSIEAMERMPKKEIKIELFEDASGINLSFEDSGEGIDSANLSKIFDPFFTTRSFKNHMGLGLGLSAAFGVLKEHNAEVKVTSQRGFGAKVMITFKKQQSVSVMKAPATKADEVTPLPVAPVAPVVEKIQIQGEVLQLKEESPHREEAETEFLEAKMQSSVGAHSPLDVNLDKLFEMPDEPSVVAGSTEQTDETEAVKPSEENASKPQAPDLDFVDNSSEERTVIASSAPVDDEFTPVSLVNAPSTPAPTKKSKADGYQVEIRRPGKRT